MNTTPDLARRCGGNSVRIGHKHVVVCVLRRAHERPEMHLLHLLRHKVHFLNQSTTIAFYARNNGQSHTSHQQQVPCMHQIDFRRPPDPTRTSIATVHAPAKNVLKFPTFLLNRHNMTSVELNARCINAVRALVGTRVDASMCGHAWRGRL